MRISIFALVLLGFSCSHTYNPTPTPGESDCGSMCKHLVEIHCEEGQPVYDSDRPGPVGVPNESCEEFCHQEEENGLNLNPVCLAQVPTCNQIEEWRLKTCR